MVKIPRTEPTVGFQPAMMPTTSGDAYAAPGRAMQQMGGAISGLGDALFDAQLKEDKYDANLAKLQYDTKADQEFIKFKENYVGDGTDFHQKYFDTIKPYRDELVSKVPQSQQKAANLYITQKDGQLAEKAMTAASGIKLGDRYAKIESTASLGIQQLQNVPPEQFEGAFTQTISGINAMIDTAPGMTPQHKEALRAKVAAEAEATLLAAPKDGATSVDQLLKSQRVKTLLDGFVKSKSDPNPVPGPQSSVGGGVFPVVGVDPASIPRDGGSKNSREHMGPRGGGQHAGWDIPAPVGAPVVAVSDGTVIAKGSGQGYGEYVDVQYADGTIHRMAHLGDQSKGGKQGAFADKIEIGSTVKAGDPLGFAGYSGNAGREFTHVHYEIFPDGKAYDAAKGGSSRATAGLRINPRQYFEGKAGASDKGGGSIAVDSSGRIDPVSFAQTMASKIANSPLNGQVPSWGKEFGITTGSPQEWARFFTMLQQQESGHRVAQTNADGSLKKFPTTPAGEQSYGPGQFKPGEYGLKTWADVNNPDKVADAYIEVAKKGKLQAYFGSLQRPNETLQHGKWYDSTVAPNLAGDAPAPVAQRGIMQGYPAGTRVASLGGGPMIPSGNDNAAPAKLPPKVVENMKGLTPEQKDAKLRDLVSRGYQDIVHQLDKDGNDVISAKQSDKPIWQRGRRGTNADGTIPNELDSETFSGPGWANGAVKDIKEGKLKRAENTIPGAQVAQAPTQQPRLVPSIESKMMESLIKKMPAIAEQDKATVGKLIDRAEEVAKKGNILPDADRLMTEKALQLIGAPKLLVDRYNLANLSAFEANQQQRSRPDQIQARKIALQAEVAKTGEATPEIQAKIKGLDDLAKHVDKELDTNMIGWGQEIGLIPKLPPIDPAKPDIAAMQAHADAARYLAQYYGREPQYFTPAVRESLTTTLKKGGDQMLATVGAMHLAYKEQLPQVMREISKDAPEAAVAGSLFAINPQAARDIAKAIERDNDPNSKGKVHKPNRAESEPVAQAELGDVFRKFPQQQRDAVLRAADAIYTVRNQTQEKWMPAIYKQALRDVIGVRVDKEGNTFGGPVATGDGWFGASGKNIMLPPDWRADTWRTTLEGVTAKDLAEAGLPLPATSDGKVISAVRLVNKGKLVQIGHGQYMVAMGDPDVPGQEKWVSAMPHPDVPTVIDKTNPQPFIFDFNKLEPILRKRMTVPFWKKG